MGRYAGRRVVKKTEGLFDALGDLFGGSKPGAADPADAQRGRFEKAKDQWNVDGQKLMDIDKEIQKAVEKEDYGELSRQMAALASGLQVLVRDAQTLSHEASSMKSTKP